MLKKSPALILFYNTGFGAPLSFYYPYNILEGTSCEISTDRIRWNEADAIVFHLPDMGDISSFKKRPGQLWVLWCQECGLNYPRMSEPKTLALFDLTMTYKLNADVVHAYYHSRFEVTFRQPVAPKSEEMLACAFISSSINRNGRQNILWQLMQHMKIDSYGKIYKTIDLPTDSGRKTKMEIISKYKFYLAFENACSKDYVTEKFYDAFEAGTVPVYLGAPNIDDFSPGQNCFINVRSFDNANELGRFLKYLDGNDSDYNSYFSWKTKKFKEPFNTLIQTPKVSLFHDLYEKVKIAMTASLWSQ